jgi:Flp pilus assembly protein TadG
MHAMRSGIGAALRGRGRTLGRDRRGNTAVVFASALVPLVGVAGVATDGLLGYLVRDRMQTSLDSAALAAGRVMTGDNWQADARRYFDANFPPGYLGTTITSFTVVPDANLETLTARASVSLPTRFMHLFGYDTTSVDVATVVARSNRSAELALVLDVTGSMRSGDKIGALKTAAHDMLDILYGNAETRDDLYVAVVPYAVTVNIGKANDDWLSMADRVHTDPGSFAPSTWKGCVMARGSGNDRTDATPAEAPFTSFYYAADTDNRWRDEDGKPITPLKEANDFRNAGTGPNLGCGPAITSLVQSKATQSAAIDELLPWHRGGTLGSLGLAWGWRALSPKWRGLWKESEAKLPLDYHTDGMDKIVVMMTDGENQLHDEPPVGPRGSDFGAYGRLNDFGYSSWSAGRDEVDRRMAQTCESMKAAGIELYTITFGPAPGAAAQELYRGCASSAAHYFHSPTNESLIAAFRKIGGELSQLRIVR